MKRSIILILFVIALLKTHAQDYLIDFGGEGDTTAVNTVQVTNLTSGANVILNGGDILHLTATTGINPYHMSDNLLQIYPNPMAEQSWLTFDAPGSGNAVINIVDESGKPVCQTGKWLASGVQSFRISGFSPGIYIVKVSGESYCYSAKLVSQSFMKTGPRIEYLSSDQHSAGLNLKSTAQMIDMIYATGDVLLYDGLSGSYESIATAMPTANQTVIFYFANCIDGDGNHYSTVKIGSQVWMAQNLKSQIRPSWCYEENQANCDTLGALYDWYTALDVCPFGWHLPGMPEWLQLFEFLQGPAIAGGSLKETGIVHWSLPNTGATNISGFTALAGGYRGTDYIFYSIGSKGRWWSASEYSSDTAWFTELISDNAISHIDPIARMSGLSIRCVRN